jgi:DNA modification methylase
MTVQVLVGDAREMLRTLPDASVHMCVTSPPYYGLRDYGTGYWEGGDEDHTHDTIGARGGKGGSGTPDKRNPEAMLSRVAAPTCECGAVRVDKQMGLEETPELWVQGMVEVFREVRRVLRPDGTLWLNIGDSYNNRAVSRPSSHQGGLGFRNESIDTSWADHASAGRAHLSITSGGLKEKDLLGIPWMLAFALRADGWWLRSDIIWSKPNPMPESVTDRPTKSHEYLFLLSKSRTYFFDQDAVREPQAESTAIKLPYGRRQMSDWKKGANGSGIKNNQSFNDATSSAVVPGGRNIRSVWTVTTEAFSEAHFACVDHETEALTPHGWRSQDELTDGELIAAYSRETGGIRWERAEFRRFPYSGEMISLDKRDTSQLLTPNHRCLVRRRVGGTAVVRADQLRAGMDVPTSAHWLPDEWETIGSDWAALLGWYVAEGHSRYRGNVVIYQSESANPTHVARIEALLKSVAADYRRHQRTRRWRGAEQTHVEFHVRGDVARRLQELAPTKTLEPRHAMLNDVEAGALLDALIDGDGHRRQDGRACIVQKNKASIDAMQMLALRLGYRAHISARPDGQFVLYLTRGEWLTLRGTNGTHDTIYSRSYHGTVWCPSVPSSFWLARRNGKPFITGNTYPTALIEPCIKAGTSERGACPECGAPWARVVERTGLVSSGPNAIADKRARTRGVQTLARSNADAGPDQYGDLPRWDTRTTGWRASCGHAGEPQPCTVLDPFAGAFTTALVSERLGRDSIMVEINPTYVEMGRKRVIGDAPMFTSVDVA